MRATYTKLKSGAWGVRVTGSVAKGDRVTVTKKDGSTKIEIVEAVVWSGNGVSVCAIGAMASSGYSYRASNGLGSLTISTNLNRGAAWMAQDLADNNYFSHTDSLGRSPYARAIDCGFHAGA